MVGTLDFYERVRVGRSGRPDPWWKRRSFGMESDGLWGMIEKDAGPRMAYHRGPTGWSLSVSAFGRSALVGRMQKANVALNVVVADDDEDEVW